MKRREFLQAAAGAAAVLTTGRSARAAQASDGTQSEAARLARKLPRWRGFNLLEKFNAGRNQAFEEDDFRFMAEWGFDFVRLPMDYRCWTHADDPYKLKEDVLAEIDRAVEFGRKHGVHVSLNLHRAPGYTVARPPEKLNLWSDEEAQRQFDFQWSAFARRYRGRRSSQLSFNLVNEPARIETAAYVNVARRATAAIRRVDPERLVISDGMRWANEPIPELIDLRIAQSMHGYQPMPLTHYQASWVNGSRWAEPTWPLKQGSEVIDQKWLDERCVRPWRELAARGVGVHVGEWGAYNRTPHHVVLRWAADVLELYQQAGFGWALWNFRGPFGILDSGRKDVAYEDFRGHKLDRKMLDLLRRM